MAIRLTNPLPGGVHTDGFGWRPPIPAAGIYEWNFHNGTDLAAPAGTPIRAAHAGRVTGVFYDHDQGGGWMVRIGAAFGYTLYGHMREQSPYVRIGDEVKAGQTIGHVGRTGWATGDHLHWILNLNGANVDPLPYLKATPTPAPTPNPALLIERQEMFIIKLKNGRWYLVLPNGAGKMRATWLPGQSGASGTGLPIFSYAKASEEQMKQLRAAVDGI